MFDSLKGRISEANSHVFGDFSHVTLGDVGIVAAEGLAAGALAVYGRLAVASRMAGAAEKVIPKVTVELENAEHLFPPGVSSLKSTLMDYARNPFTNVFSPMKFRRVELVRAGGNVGVKPASEPTGTILNMVKGPDGAFTIM